VQSWNNFVQGRNTIVQGWNAFDSVGIPLYRVGMLSTVLECHCTELECFRQSWNAYNRVGITLYRVGMLSTVLEYHCTGLEFFR
jgi:hypothetical protein